MSALITPEQRRAVTRLRARLCSFSFWRFVNEFWECVPGAGTMIPNWHMHYLANELQCIAERVFRNEPKAYDLLINIPPGTSKSTICSILFHPWTWTRMPNARHITASHTDTLVLDLSTKAREVIESEKYRAYYPHIQLRRAQATKSYYANTLGGDRVSCTVGGRSPMGLHGHFLCLPYYARVVTDQGLIPVGGLVQENLQVRVLGYDHDTKQTRWCEIEGRGSSPGRTIYRIHLSNGTTLDATENHPVYVEGRGYVNAKNLNTGDEVVYAAVPVSDLREGRQEISLSQESQHLLLQEVLREAQIQTNDGGSTPSIQSQVEGLQELRQVISVHVGEEEDGLILQLPVPGRSNEGEEQPPPCGPCDDGLSILQRDHVLGSFGHDDTEVLRQDLCRQSTFDQHERTEEPELHSRPGVRIVPERVQGNLREGTRAGEASLLPLRQNEEAEQESGTGRSPHRLGQEQQRDGEPRCSLPVLPYKPSRGTEETPATSKAIVTKVELLLWIPEEVFNLEVAGVHNYFAEGVLVHNSWDDPIDPQKALSDVELKNAGDFAPNVLFTRKVNKEVSVFFGIMQRLHFADPAGVLLERTKKEGADPLKLICLPAELADNVCPSELRHRYKEGLLDPVRLSKKVLDAQRVDGIYKYSSQFMQCLVGDTLVRTVRGDVPIQCVLAGDLVLTRSGWREVKWSGKTGDAEKLCSVIFSSGDSVTGTPNHPVWVDGVGWKNLEHLEREDRVWAGLRRKQPRSSSLTVRRTTGQEERNTSRPTTIVPEASICIETCGGSITEPSRKDTPSTTRTTTRLTIGLTIWRPLPFESMANVMRTVRRNVERFLIQYGTKGRNGRIPKRQSDTIESLVESASRSIGNRLSTSLTFVTGAESRSCPAVIESPGSVLRLAGNEVGERRNTITSASSVERTLLALDGTPRTAQRSVPPCTGVPVYDLTVSDEPEFFANGVLVHNSPVPLGGSMFKPEYFNHRVAAAPMDAQRVFFVDRASTEDGGCFTAGVLMARDRDGRYYVEWVMHGQWEPITRNKRIRAAALKFRAKYGPHNEPTIYIEAEGGSAGKDAWLGIVRELQGFTVREEQVVGKGKKAVRAEPWSSMCASGNTALVSDGCFVAGTLISTINGLKSIETVREGDLVLTRRGYRHVLKSWMTKRVDEVVSVRFSNGATLTGTRNHKIWTQNRGWIDLADCSCDDNMITDGSVNQGESLWAREVRSQSLLPRQSCSEGLSTIYAKGLRTITVMSEGTYIEQSGKIVTDLSQKDTTYTTEIVIKPTTTLGIFSAYLNIGTDRFTQALKSIWSILTGSGHLRSNGVQQRQVERPVVEQPKRIGLQGSHLNLHAISVGLDSLPREPLSNSAPNNAKRSFITMRELITNEDPVVSAEIPIAHLVEEEKLALGSVQPYLGGIPVYDLTVEDCHEFFANGVLVHNSWDINNYVQEHCAFPLGRFLDQVDASSGAFNVLANMRRNIGMRVYSLGTGKQKGLRVVFCTRKELESTVIDDRCLLVCVSDPHPVGTEQIPIHGLNKCVDSTVLQFADIDPDDWKEVWEEEVEPYDKKPEELLFTREMGKQLWSFLLKKRDPQCQVIVLVDDGEGRALSVGMAIADTLRLPRDSSLYSVVEPDNKYGGTKPPCKHLYDMVKATRNLVYG